MHRLKTVPKLFTKVLQLLESWVFRAQGKGWGGASIKTEVESVAKLLGSCNPKLCIDVGGNKGDYTAALLSKFPNTRVVVFEPSSLNFGALKKRFTGLHNVSLEMAAISSEDQHSTFLYSDSNGSGLASLTKRRLDHFGITFDFSEVVRTVTFEKYWEENLDKQIIDLVKLDIEGHELPALQGFGDAIRRVHLIQFEFGGCNIDTRTFFQQFWYFFKEKGFIIHRVTPLGLESLDSYRESDEFFSTTNFVAENLSFRNNGMAPKAT